MEKKSTNSFIIRNMPPSVHRTLRILAAETGGSMNELIIRYIEEGLKRDGK